ncbi:MAG TPA: ABC transporter substrate-binding protein [Alphaproteobacteria bacterium]|jgi:ABC-type nitrate/sulfonate/bicarbonate transport system substrate-binding protein
MTVTGYYRRPPHLVAVHKGFWAREGLEIDFHTVDLAPEHNKEMAAGVWNMTLSSADTMLARATQDGVDYVAFMQAEEGLNVQLVGRKEIASPKELRGKLLAADPIDSNFDLVRNKILRDFGVDEAEYEIDILGNTPFRAKALMEGKVAAAMLVPPFTDRAVEAGYHVLAEGADHISDWPLACGWGLRSWVEANRPLVVRFLRGWANAADWLQRPENKRETLDLLMKEEKVSEKRAEEAYARVVPKGRINPEAVRKNIELRIELGYYKPPHKSTESFYDLSYWSEATGLPAPPPAGMPKNGKA